MTHPYILPSEGVEATEDVGCGVLAALGGRHLALSALHELGRDVGARSVLEERLACSLQGSDGRLHQRTIEVRRACRHEQENINHKFTQQISHTIA
jgi:hypothetical protein